MQDLDPKQGYRTALIIACAMMGCLVPYAVVVEVIRIQIKPFKGFAPGSVMEEKELYYGLALIMLLAVTRLKNSLLKVSTNDRAILVKRLLLSTIVAFALSEVPAILGFVLFLLGGLYKEFYILLAYSALVMLVHFPRYGNWEAFLLRHS